ncbi:DUF4129 domain-containing protein [Thiohalocapsa sp. ML1]|jgi:hypothetical protein|uniref:DUF4129 domain-containing protein n=1 Tax=Thiohalocapsa sp. ML1 TaxID=1431688 RepID=UPI0007321191|nr:DUF4129 domain-containing protein [Thiohalocapsa sp. ML1]
MDLTQTAAAIRPRTPWESIDLGFALARTWFVPLWLCWWLTAAPVALLALVPLHGSSDLWLLLLWWLKPAFEALPLYWLSRAMFGERLAPRAAARRLPRALPTRLWPQLAWRRFGLARSFTMPVTLLEAPRGGARRERLRVLGTGAAGWLTVICVHLEGVLWLSALLALAFLLPEGMPRLDLGEALLESGSPADWTGALLVLLAMSVMAPFYVAAGFALYLGRRTTLEAWDLELAFRRAADRRTARPGAPVSALLVVLALSATVMAPGESGAAEPPTAAEARALIAEVLADPDFGSTRERSVWVFVGEAADAADAADDRADGAAWLPTWLIESIALLLKWVVLIGAAILLALLLLRLVRELRLPGWRRGAPKPGGQAATGVPVGAEPAPLPLDIPAEVLRLLAAGDARGALSLLYRSQIVRLRTAGLDLPDSATEAECLNAAAAAAPAAQVDWLRRLVALWQAVAYGHRDADPRAVQALLDAHQALGTPRGAHG